MKTTENIFFPRFRKTFKVKHVIYRSHWGTLTPRADRPSRLRHQRRPHLCTDRQGRLHWACASPCRLGARPGKRSSPVWSDEWCRCPASRSPRRIWRPLSPKSCKLLCLCLWRAPNLSRCLLGLRSSGHNE